MLPLDDDDSTGQPHVDPDDRTLTAPLGVPAMPMKDVIAGVPDTKEAEMAWKECSIGICQAAVGRIATIRKAVSK